MARIQILDVAFFFRSRFNGYPKQRFSASIIILYLRLSSFIITSTQPVPKPGDWMSVSSWGSLNIRQVFPRLRRSVNIPFQLRTVISRGGIRDASDIPQLGSAS